MRVDRGAMTPATLTRLGALIADDSTAMLEYVTTDEGSTLFILTRNDGRLALSATPLRASRDDIERQLASFLDSLRSRDLGFADASRRLSDILLKNAEPHLRGKTHLIIVPDGPLWSVPFEALKTADGRFLIERASVSYAPSLTAYAEMVRALRRKETRPRPTLLAFANPVGAMAPLPDAEAEARQVAALYPRSTVRLGRDASVAAFKREASQYDVIHLATHAVADDADPMYSYLVFAGDDGRLEAWQVAELDVHARMVVLSACETGAGRYSGGEGMIGLSWAWLIAGAPTTVVSRWSIDSAATSVLMTRFHERLTASPGMSAAEALRRAEVSMLNDAHYRHPFYWASFQVVGAG